MKVSIITPTSAQRQNYFSSLYHCFKSQSYSNCELLVLEDNSSGSSFFSHLDDPAVRYFYTERKVTIGEKRNQLIQAADGEVIVHFDDDDYYSPTYVEQLLQQLGENDFVTLSGWYAYVPKYDFFCYWDTTQVSNYHFDVRPKSEISAFSLEGISPEQKHDWIDSNLWGYGFSYGYRKNLFESLQFDAVDFGEDLKLVQTIKALGYKTHHFLDQSGLALHIVHDQNMSMMFPQFSLPSFLLPQTFGLEILEFLFASQTE